MEQTSEPQTLEQLVNQLMEEYEYIAAIHASHPTLAFSDPTLHIKIHTSAADGHEEHLDVIPSGEIKVNITTEESVTVPASVIATCAGPGGIQRTEGTTIYKHDNVLGAEPRDAETGLSMVRQKLAGRCPHCGATPDSFYDHYSDNADCVEAELL